MLFVHPDTRTYSQLNRKIRYEILFYVYDITKYSYLVSTFLFTSIYRVVARRSKPTLYATKRELCPSLCRHLAVVYFMKGVRVGAVS